MNIIAENRYDVYNEDFVWIINVTNDIKFIEFVEFDKNEANMNNVNVNFKVEDSTECFSISERRSIINIKNVESNHCINFAVFKKRNRRSF